MFDFSLSVEQIRFTDYITFIIPDVTGNVKPKAPYLWRR